MLVLSFPFLRFASGENGETANSDHLSAKSEIRISKYETNPKHEYRNKTGHQYETRTGRANEILHCVQNDSGESLVVSGQPSAKSEIRIWKYETLDNNQETRNNNQTRDNDQETRNNNQETRNKPGRGS
jgi:hypothetical protein